MVYLLICFITFHKWVIIIIIIIVRDKCNKEKTAVK